VASADTHLSDELAPLQAEFAGRIDLVNRLAAEMSIPLADLSPSPIWYLDVGSYDSMAKLFVGMRDSGFFLNGSAFPVVPHGHAGLRFTITMHNSARQIEDMLTALRERSLEVIGETEIMIDLTTDIAAKEKSSSS
jgi:7-keto-8-aminopelargonate synthetase-like enzyme